MVCPPRAECENAEEPLRRTATASLRIPCSDETARRGCCAFDARAQPPIFVPGALLPPRPRPRVPLGPRSRVCTGYGRLGLFRRQSERFGPAAAIRRGAGPLEFIRCPRGSGSASIRLFEAMAAGRVRLILSEAPVPPKALWGARLPFRARVSGNEPVPAAVRA